jgi:hypothetical protein
MFVGCSQGETNLHLTWNKHDIFAQQQKEYSMISGTLTIVCSSKACFITRTYDHLCPSTTSRSDHHRCVLVVRMSPDDVWDAEIVAPRNNHKNNNHNHKNNNNNQHEEQQKGCLDATNYTPSVGIRTETRTATIGQTYYIRSWIRCNYPCVATFRSQRPSILIAVLQRLRWLFSMILMAVQPFTPYTTGEYTGSSSYHERWNHCHYGNRNTHRMVPSRKLVFLAQ